jgi:hypothetical protein
MQLRVTARRRAVLATLLLAALPPVLYPAAPRAAAASGGYWGVASDGGVFAFGDAAFLGSTGALRLNQPVVGMAATPSGSGYWLVASDGGIFTFGDARFHGSTGAVKLNRPVVGMAATPTGRGYWLVASDGGIFTFGDARFHGSSGGKVLDKPIQGMAASPTGAGYWFVANDGGVFAFGDAGFYGAATDDRPRRGNRKVVAIVPSLTGRGYWLGTANGDVLAFGDASDLGGAGDLNLPFVGLATRAAGAPAPSRSPASPPGAAPAPGSAPAPYDPGAVPEQFITAANSTWGTAPAPDVAGMAGKVLRMLEAGDALYLAGEFTGMVPPGTPEGAVDGVVPRNYLAALSASTGELLPFNPDPNGPVRALALSPDGRRLYIGGTFETVGGAPARNLAAVNLATGALDPGFEPPRLNSGVRSLALAGDRLYVGGNFTEAVSPAGALARPQLAAFDAGTGALLDWLPPANQGGEFFSHTGQERSSGNGIVFDIALSGDGKNLFAAGTFVDFGGQSGLVSLDTTTGQPTDWQAGLDWPVFAVEVWRGDGHTLFASTGGAGGLLYAFNPGAKKDVAWIVKTDGDNMDVVATATKVYLLGHYDFIVDAKSSCYQQCPRGNPRRHLSAFDAATGKIDPDWHPVANTNTGPYTAVIGSHNLWIGGEFTSVNRQPQPGVVQFPALQ